MRATPSRRASCADRLACRRVRTATLLTFDPSVLSTPTPTPSTLASTTPCRRSQRPATLPSGTPLVYFGALGTAVENLTDGTTYYVIQDSAEPRPDALTTAGAAQAIATATAGKAYYNTLFQAAYTAGYDAYIAANPTDAHLIQDATSAGNAAAQTALSQADNGEDWTAAAIDSARVGQSAPRRHL